MYKYKTLRQLYKIVLQSNDADLKETVTKVGNGANIDVVKKYFFNLKTPTIISKTARLAVRSFLCNNVNSNLDNAVSIGGVYSPTLSQRNVYQSSGTTKGVHLLSQNFKKLQQNDYQNPDYDMNYIDIQNNINWLNEGIEIIVDTKLLDDNGVDIGGCPDVDNWVLELIIYDDVLEKNPDFETDIKAVNTAAPTV